MRRILLIGCGQLGRRHIEGLGRSAAQIHLHVFDSNKASLVTCENFCTELATKIRNITLTLHHSLDFLKKIETRFDLIIISTTAAGRIPLIKSVLQSTDADGWLLEKPLCQSPTELHELSELMKNKAIWVNHFRRTIGWYESLRDNHFKGNAIDISFKGPRLGIGCNISHMVDLVNYLTGELPLKLDTSGLSSIWIDSKRPSFKEVEGTVVCNFSGGSQLQVISDLSYAKSLINGRVIDTNQEFLIDEDRKNFTFNNRNYPLTHLPLQSQMTGLIFDQIYKTQNCKLTSFEVAVECYRPVINALLEHWQKTSGNPSDSCLPIT